MNVVQHMRQNLSGKIPKEGEGVQGFTQNVRLLIVMNLNYLS